MIKDWKGIDPGQGSDLISYHLASSTLIFNQTKKLDLYFTLWFQVWSEDQGCRSNCPAAFFNFFLPCTQGCRTRFFLPTRYSRFLPHVPHPFPPRKIETNNILTCLRDYSFIFLPNAAHVVNRVTCLLICVAAVQDGSVYHMFYELVTNRVLRKDLLLCSCYKMLVYLISLNKQYH